MLEKEFRSQGLNLNRMIREGILKKECRTRKNQNFEHILFCIGDGSIRCEELSGWFAETRKPEGNEIEDVQELPAKDSASSTGEDFVVEGAMGVNSRLAKCCKPSVGDPIRGYLTQGGVVTVHHSRCRSFRTMDMRRYVSVHWQ